jgi:hypothetical protein
MRGFPAVKRIKRLERSENIRKRNKMMNAKEAREMAKRCRAGELALEKFMQWVEREAQLGHTHGYYFGVITKETFETLTDLGYRICNPSTVLSDKYGPHVSWE